MEKKVIMHAVSGFSEVGKNMTAIEIDDDVLLCDSGLFLPSVVGVAEREKIPTEKGMRELGAMPDDLYLEKKRLREKVRSILISHAHLDHLGALPYNAYRYNADIIGTPFSLEVLKLLLENKKLRNRLIPINPNNSYTVKGRRTTYKVEFLNMTHSTLQTAVIAIHTPSGVIMYVNDYKLDNTPIMGDKPNYKRIKELSRQGVKALIVDCLYAGDDRKTPSEKIAKGLLEDVFFTTENRNSGMVVTTFSSHIARLKTIAELGRKLNRDVYFIGRSLNKYLTAARNIKQAHFIHPNQVVTFRNQIQSLMKRVNKNRRNYLLVCTGHQGEPGSVLDRISRHDLPLHLSQDDQIIFSSKTIPTPINETNRQQLEKRLRKYNVRIFDNVHVSGHGGREDLRDLIKLTNPEHVIPAHGDLKKLNAGIELAEEMGYRLNKNVHLMQNGKSIMLH